MMNGALAAGGTLEEAHGLLGVVDVVSADGELAVGNLEELRGGDDHVWVIFRLEVEKSRRNLGQ